MKDNNNLINLIKEMLESGGVRIPALKAKDIADHMRNGHKINFDDMMIYKPSLQLLNLLQQKEFKDGIDIKNGIWKSNDIIKLSFDDGQVDTDTIKQRNKNYSKKDLEKLEKELSTLTQKRKDLIDKIDNEINEVLPNFFEDYGAESIDDFNLDKQLERVFNNKLNEFKRKLKKETQKSSPDPEKVKMFEEKTNKVQSIIDLKNELGRNNEAINSAEQSKASKLDKADRISNMKDRDRDSSYLSKEEQEELDRLSGEISAKENSISELENNKNSLNKELNKKKRQLKKLSEEDGSELTKEIEELTEEKSKLTKSIKEEKTALKSLKSRSKDITKERIKSTGAELRERFYEEGFWIEETSYSKSLQKDIRGVEDRYKKLFKEAKGNNDLIKQLTQSKAEELSKLLEDRVSEITVTKKHYSRLKRSSSQARVGNVLFMCDGTIDSNGKLAKNKMYDATKQWFEAGVGEAFEVLSQKDSNTKIDLITKETYQSMVDSSCERFVKINPDNILVIPDIEAIIGCDTKDVFKNSDGWCDVRSGKGTKNVLFDGQSLVDSSMYTDIFGNKIDESMILLRGRYIKSAGIKCEVQQYLKDYADKIGVKFEDLYLTDVFGNKIKASDVKMITTNNSIKYFKTGSTFEKAYGTTPKELWENVKDMIREDGNTFGVVKSEHASKVLGGNYQNSTYQHFNCLLNMDNKSTREVLERCEEVMTKLSEDNSFFLTYIKSQANEFNQYDLWIDRLESNSDWVNTKEFYNFRKEVKRSYKEMVAQGHIPIIGDNLTIFGNGMEMLRSATGEMDEYVEKIVKNGKTDIYTVKLKKDYECPEFSNKFYDSVEEEVFGLYTKQFANGENITCNRSPQATSANVAFGKNRCGSKSCESIDKYFPELSPNMAYCDETRVGIQATLQGADHDSDFVMATNNKVYWEHSRERVGKHLIVDTSIDTVANEYTNSAKDLARLDNTLANSKTDIGATANLSQVAVSQKNHYDYILSLEDGAERKELLKEINMSLDNVQKNKAEMEGVIEILSIMEGQSIDSAKKKYYNELEDKMGQGFKGQIRHLKEKDCWIGGKHTDGKEYIVAPQFMDGIVSKQSYPVKMKLHTPMDLAQEELKKISEETRGTKSPKGKNIADMLLSEEEFGFQKDKVQYNKRLNPFLEEVLELDNKRIGLLSRISSTNDKDVQKELYDVLNNLEEEFINKWKKRTLNDNEVYLILDRIYNPKNKSYQEYSKSRTEINKMLNKLYPDKINKCFKKGEGLIPSSGKLTEEANKLIDKFQLRADKTVKDIDQLFTEMINDLNADVEKIYINNIEGMSRAEGIAYMNGIITTEQYNLLKDKLPDNAKARISRIEALKQEIAFQCNKVGWLAHDKMTKLFSEVVEESYNYFHYNHSKMLGLGMSFSRIPKNTVEAILNKPSYTMTLGQRTMRNIKVNEEKLTEIVFKGIMEGKSQQKMYRELKEQSEHSLNSCKQIIRTEVTHYANEGNLRAMERLGIEKYVFIATLDSRTSTVCRDLDGKIFEVKDRKEGINCPAMHPYCRSTTITYFDDEVLANMKRRAKDKNGNYVILDKFMTYEEYCKKFLKD